VDFVVVGLGLGTLAILVGLLTLVWAAGRWERAAARATTPEDAAHDQAMAAGRRDAGQALIGAGVAVLIATIGALAGSLDDQTGAFFVTTTATVAALGLLVWAYLYRTRNPLPQRARTEDGGRRTEDESWGDAPGTSEPSTAGAVPLEAEQVVEDEAAEQEPSIAPLPAAASDLSVEPELIETDEDDDTAHEAPAQLDPAMNGANDAPLAVHEHEDDWEGRRDRKA
jgi:hypothetical protein